MERNSQFLLFSLINRSNVGGSGEKLGVSVDVVGGHVQAVAYGHLVWVTVKAIYESTESGVFISVRFALPSEVASVGVVVWVGVGFLKEGWSHIWDINCVLNNFEGLDWLGDGGHVFLNVEVGIVARVEGVDGVAAVGVAVGAAIGVVAVVTGLMSVVTITNLTVGVVVKSTVAIAAAIDSTEVATITEIVESVGVSTVSKSGVSSPFWFAFEGTKTTVGSEVSTSVVSTVTSWSEFVVAKTVVIIVSVISLIWVIRFGVHTDVAKSISYKSDLFVISVVNVGIELTVVVSVETTTDTRLARVVVRVKKTISRFGVLIGVVVGLNRAERNNGLNSGVRLLISETCAIRVLVEESSLVSDVIGDLVVHWLEVGTNDSLVMCNSERYLVVVVVFVCSLKAYCFSGSNEESSLEGSHNVLISC